MVEWTGARYADCPTVEVETQVDASPEVVWAIVSDPLLMPQLSSEVQRVEWLGGASAAAVGATFRGHNHNVALGDWSTTSTIIECDPPRVYAWAVEGPDNPTATWRFVLAAQDGGTRLRQWAQMGPGPSGLTMAIAQQPDKEEKIVFVRLRDFERGMIGNLAQIKQRAEAAS